VSEKAKRRWYQFSLWVLILIVTLAAVALGGRIEYLRRMSGYHVQQEKLFLEKMKILADKGDGKYEDYYQLAASAVHHKEMQRRYSAALQRPWTLVSHNPAPVERSILARDARDLWRLFAGPEDSRSTPGIPYKRADELMRKYEAKPLPTSSAPAPNPPKE